MAWTGRGFVKAMFVEFRNVISNAPMMGPLFLLDGMINQVAGAQWRRL